jgi:hypothetical protein
MKVKFLLFILLLLLFACSNDGFDSRVAASAQKNISCYIVSKNKCSTISEKLCGEIGGKEVTTCPSEEPESSSSTENSSSSEEVSSSSSGETSSSSSDEVSSSSGGETSSSSGDEVSSSSGVETSSSSVIPEPIVKGSLTLKNTLSDGISNAYYYSIGTILTPTLIESTVQIDNKIEALCGGITLKWKSNNTAIPETIVRAVAVAECNEVEIELKSIEATVVANPELSNCTLPSPYLHKGDVLTNLASLNNNYGRCTVEYEVATYVPSTPSISKPPIGATLPLTNYVGKTITVRAQANCINGITVSGKNCQAVSVENNYKLFDEMGKQETIPIGKTVIEIKDSLIELGDYQQKHFGCQANGEFSTPSTVFSVNGGPNLEPDWWKRIDDIIVSQDSLSKNNNRILIETKTPNVESFKCAIEW